MKPDFVVFPEVSLANVCSLYFGSFLLLESFVYLMLILVS